MFWCGGFSAPSRQHIVISENWTTSVYVYLEDSSKGNPNYYVIDNKLKFEYPCKSTSDCTPYIINLPRGDYVFEIVGASGGDYAGTNMAGLGGYSSGLYRVYWPSTLYLYIGGQGMMGALETGKKSGNSESGYNGGGKAYGECGTGGGATDLRTIGGIINSNKSINSRLLVAGGGGGSRQHLGKNAKGGNGGGKQGVAGKPLGNNKPCYGTQNGCIGGIGTTANGTLWEGASAHDGFGYNYGGAGAGGGYYGGGTCAECAGSGGSGMAKYPILNGFTKEYNHTGNGYALLTYYEYTETYRFEIHQFQYVFLLYHLLQ